MFTEYDVAQGIVKFQFKTWGFRATLYSVNSQAIIPMCSETLLERPLSLSFDKTNKMSVRPAKTQISLPPSLIRVFAVRMKKAGILSYPLSANEDSDQTGRMPRLI